MNPSARHLTIAMILLVGMIAYGSLYPFAFHTVPDGVGPFRTLLGNWDRMPGRGDFISNILLYMPLGFVGATSPRGRAGSKRLLATVLLGAALSFSVETLQYYDLGRDTQATDFYANTLGTAFGVVAGWTFGRDFQWPLLRELSANRVPALLLAAWVGYRLYPYVPTINLHKYWDSLKPVVLHPQVVPYAIFRQTAVWMTIAVLIERIAGRERLTRVYPGFAGFMLLSCILIISTWISVQQIAGIVLAFVICLAVRRHRLGPVYIATALLGVYVTTFRLEPFEFGTIAGQYGWIPFYSFMQGSIDVDVRSFFEKVFLYGGLIWLLAQAGMAWRFSTGLVSLLLLGTSILQTYIPGRSAEITDAILALTVGEFMRALELRAEDRPGSATSRIARFRAMRALSATAVGDTLSRRIRDRDSAGEIGEAAE